MSVLDHNYLSSQSEWALSSISPGLVYKGFNTYNPTPGSFTTICTLCHGTKTSHVLVSYWQWPKWCTGWDVLTAWASSPVCKYWQSLSGKRWNVYQHQENKSRAHTASRGSLMMSQKTKAARLMYQDTTSVQIQSAAAWKHNVEAKQSFLKVKKWNI